MGIPVNRVISCTFVLGSALAAAAGAARTPVAAPHRPAHGAHVGLKAFVAAVIGGIGNVPGAMAGRAAARARRGVRGRLHRLVLPRRDRLRHPHPGAAGPARGAASAASPWRRSDGARARLVLRSVRARSCVGAAASSGSSQGALTPRRLLARPHHVGVNVILAVSLNMVNGFTGQFSIGHAGFMAVGAYTAALVTTGAGRPSSWPCCRAARLRPGALRPGARRRAWRRPRWPGSWWACPRCGCAATTWPSSRWASARSSGWSSRTPGCSDRPPASPASPPCTNVVWVGIWRGRHRGHGPAARRLHAGAGAPRHPRGRGGRRGDGRRHHRLQGARLRHLGRLRRAGRRAVRPHDPAGHAAHVHLRRRSRWW